MAARRDNRHTDSVREKIQASQLVNRLNDFVFGKVHMEKAQVSAALGLLKKTLPDLQAIQHTGDADAPVIHRIERVIVKAQNPNR